MTMKQISTKGLLLKVIVPATAISVSYLLLGQVCRIPHLLLFCILGTFILVPIELGQILVASKREYGAYSLKSAFVGQEKLATWKVLVIAFVFFGIAGLLSVTVAPLEAGFFEGIRETVLGKLPQGFDWTDFDYLKLYSKPLRVVTCVYYALFNVIVGPITEELYFRGYLTSHYKKQSRMTPILIAVLFSFYHFWLPFNNIFRILLFSSVAYVAYRKRNLYISIGFHCLCNLFSVVGFIATVWA